MKRIKKIRVKLSKRNIRLAKEMANNELFKILQGAFGDEVVCVDSMLKDITKVMIARVEKLVLTNKIAA